MKSKRLILAASVAVACAITMLAARSAQAQAYKALHRFNGPDGEYPDWVIRDDDGIFYGTAAGGGGKGTCNLNGTPGCGVVFKVNTSGKETVLYRFKGGSDGFGPYGLVRDAAGNLYGTTGNGGDDVCDLGCGTVFKLSGAGKLTVLYRFRGGADGQDPEGVIHDSNGNLYGTTYWGGTGQCSNEGYPGCGTIFKVDASGRHTVLYRFTGGGRWRESKWGTHLGCGRKPHRNHSAGGRL
jgi:uncharacterized repeat protein (TIGR03803 family)